MRESGIYDKWEGSYLNKWDDVEEEDDDDIVGFKVACLKHFLGLSVICAGLIVISVLVVFLEILLHSKMKNAESNPEVSLGIELNVPFTSNSSLVFSNTLTLNDKTMSRRQSRQKRILCHYMQLNAY